MPKPADPRAERLAAALRANLAKRKARERSVDAPDEALPPAADAPGGAAA